MGRYGSGFVHRTVFLPIVALALAAPAEALDLDRAQRLEVAVGATSVQATAGTYCVQQPEADGTERGDCTEVPYPLRTRGRLTLKPGARVRMRFEATPSSVKWRLLDAARAEPATVLFGIAHRKRDAKRRFVFTLPRKLPDAAVLDIAVLYREGPRKSDQDFWAAVRVKR